jgi:hypothetical protein
MGWKFYDEAVEMQGLRHRFLPQHFRWRGRFYEVDSVERCWTRGQRRYYRALCGPGVFELYQDLGAGTWHLRRARLAPARGVAIRRFAPAWR